MEQNHKSDEKGIDFVRTIRKELSGIVSRPLDMTNKDLSLQNGKEINPLKQSGIKVLRRGPIRKLGEAYLEISVPDSSDFPVKYVMQQLVARLAMKGLQVRFVNHKDPTRETGLVGFDPDKDCLQVNNCRVTLLRLINRK